MLMAQPTENITDTSVAYVKFDQMSVALNKLANYNRMKISNHVLNLGFNESIYLPTTNRGVLLYTGLKNFIRRTKSIIKTTS